MNGPGGRTRSRALLTGVALLTVFSASGCAPESPEEASGSSGSAASTGGGGSSCAAVADAIAGEVSGQATCSATVRLDYRTRRPLGFQLSCGPTAPVDVATALATAVADTRIHFSESLTEDAPADDFVFYRAPIDFGGVAVVSARSGVTVFGGGIVWDGHGDVVVPASFRPASRLGPGCGSTRREIAARGFDLRSKDALDAGAIGDALDAVNETALPEAMARGGRLRDAMVLLYPRAVGLFDPTTAAWIVVLNTGG